MSGIAKAVFVGIATVIATFLLITFSASFVRWEWCFDYADMSNDGRFWLLVAGVASIIAGGAAGGIYAVTKE